MGQNLLHRAFRAGLEVFLESVGGFSDFVAGAASGDTEYRRRASGAIRLGRAVVFWYAGCLCGNHHPHSSPVNDRAHHVPTRARIFLPMGVVASVFPQGDLWRATVVSTFVTVGNATRPFKRLLEAVGKIAGELPQPVFVQYGAGSMSDCPGCTGAAFLDMAAFEQHVREAELLILHAGAGSVIHAVRAGKIPVIMPRRARLGEHVDDHQEEFAEELAKTGKVMVAHDAATMTVAVACALALQKTEHYEVQRETAMIGSVRRALSGAVDVTASRKT